MFIRIFTIVRKKTYFPRSHSNDRINDVAGRNPYETKTVFAVVPLKQELRGNTLAFKLPGNLIHTNSAFSLSQVQIDFDNGQGYQTIALNTAKNVVYNCSGIKEIKDISLFKPTTK